jgi:hypothetical protein
MGLPRVNGLMTRNLGMRRLLITGAAIGILCRAYFDRWRRPVTGARWLTPAEFWRQHKAALSRAIEPQPAQRVYLSHQGIFVWLGRDTAYLYISSSEGSRRIWLAFSQAADFAKGAMLACQNRNLFEMTVGDISLKVDARVRPAPETILQRVFQMMAGLTPERLVFDVWYAGRYYLALDRDFFEAGLRELSIQLAVLPDRDEPQQVKAR